MARRLVRWVALGIGSTVVLASVALPTTQAMLPAITFNSVPSIITPNQRLEISGTVTSRCSERTVTISRKSINSWARMTSTVADELNVWKVTITAPPFNGTLILRADCGAYYAAQQITAVASINPVQSIGPGKHILGMDISRWQHIPGQSIDFATMAKAGIAFVIIKASDGYGAEDRIAQKYVFQDSIAAKQAGLIVGYYHVVSIPTGNVETTYIASATAQAKLAVRRLRSLGGYDGRTLPLTLDMEGVNSSVSQKSLFTWTKTFVQTVEQLSRRTPIMYSYRSFLASRYSKNSQTVNFLRRMHLWLAQPGNPADLTVNVGGFDGNNKKCFRTAWARSDCSTAWTMWQYTNRGNRDTYGIPWRPLPNHSCPSHAKFCVPGSGTGPLHLDLDVVNGTPAQLLDLVSGSWTRQPTDYLTTSPTPLPSISVSPSSSATP